jgi:hypothetical protein
MKFMGEEYPGIIQDVTNPNKQTQPPLRANLRGQA